MTSLCYRCREFLDTEAVFAFDQLWHNNCFRCFKCEKSLINEWYIKLQESGDNNVVCVECSKPLCNGCNKCIDDERVKAIGVLWHRECLKCTECNETLINEFSLYQNRPICIMCFKKYPQRSIVEGSKSPTAYLTFNSGSNPSLAAVSKFDNTVPNFETFEFRNFAFLTKPSKNAD